MEYIIFYDKSGRRILLNPDHIVKAKARGKYTAVDLSSGECIKTGLSLTSFEALINDSKVYNS